MIFWLIACAPAPEAGETSPRHVPDSRARRVEVVALGDEGPPTLTLTLPGEVEGGKDVVLSTPLGGLVERVNVGKGGAVKQGQVIARIDAEIHDAQLAIAEAQYDQADKENERLVRMGDLATQSQRLQAETTKKITAAQVRSARATVARSVITAPFSGIAADVFPDASEFLGPGSPVARVVQLDPVLVTLSVADKDVVGLTTGMEVEVMAAATGVPVTGHIVHVGQAADMRTRAFPVEVEVPNPDHHLLPGMIATVNVAQQLPEGTLAVPQDWIVTRRSGQGVFIETEGFAKWTPVKLGGVLHDQIVITDGLSPGDRLVVSGHRDLVDGDAVLVAREGRCCVNGRPVYGTGG